MSEQIVVIHLHFFVKAWLSGYVFFVFLEIIKYLVLRLR